MSIDFIISALDRALFEGLFGMADGQLAARGIRRLIADENPGFPCRVSLEDAAVGEPVLLLSFEHHRADSPYRGNGPIIVREGARQALPPVNHVPHSVRSRQLSLRAYDRAGMLVNSDLASGMELERVVTALFSAPQAEYIHIHNAKPGCYNCRVDRAAAVVATRIAPV